MCKSTDVSWHVHCTVDESVKTACMFDLKSKVLKQEMNVWQTCKLFPELFPELSAAPYSVSIAAGVKGSDRVNTNTPTTGPSSRTRMLPWTHGALSSQLPFQDLPACARANTHKIMVLCKGCSFVCYARSWSGSTNPGGKT